MAKIKVNKEVRRLLVELDDAFQKFDVIIEKLSGGNTTDPELGDLGIARISAEHWIQAIAYKINNAATGKKDIFETYVSIR